MSAEVQSASDVEHAVVPTVRPYRNPKEMHGERKRTIGQRAADEVSGFTGSWRFIFIYMALTAGWCVMNVIGAVQHWDPYPFIFYTFSVSVLAILMSSLILLAGNRQAEVDRAHAENAYHHVDEVNDKQDRQLQILHLQLDLIQQQVRSAVEQHGEILQQLASIVAMQRQEERTDTTRQG